MKPGTRLRISATIASILLLGSMSTEVAAATYTGNVTVLQTSLADCFYFKIEGVVQTDPPTLGGWFAVPVGAEAAKNIMAVVLSARVTERPVTVATTGTTVCNGYAQATHVTI